MILFVIVGLLFAMLCIHLIIADLTEIGELRTQVIRRMAKLGSNLLKLEDKLNSGHCPMLGSNFLV